MFVSGTQGQVPSKGRASVTYSFLKSQIQDPENVTAKRSSLSIDWNTVVKSTCTKSDQNAEIFLHSIIPVQTTTEFNTGSSYVGKWNALGMTESGTYKFFHGCEYQGGFDDGRFHGEGTLTYPMGQKLKCLYAKGKLISYKFINVDGDLSKDCSEYCQFPDRRFNVEHLGGLQPADKELLTNRQPTRHLPKGLCDTGDGYYNSESGVIFRARKIHLSEKTGLDKQVLESSSLEKKEEKGKLEVIPEEEEFEEEEMQKEEIQEKELKEEETQEDDSLWMNKVIMVDKERGKWLLKYCRKGWDEPAGPRPEFYEEWITGRKKELNMMKKYEEK